MEEWVTTESNTVDPTLSKERRFCAKLWCLK